MPDEEPTHVREDAEATAVLTVLERLRVMRRDRGAIPEGDLDEDKGVAIGAHRDALLEAAPSGRKVRA